MDEKFEIITAYKLPDGRIFENSSDAIKATEEIELAKRLKKFLDKHTFIGEDDQDEMVEILVQNRELLLKALNNEENG